MPSPDLLDTNYHIETFNPNLHDSAVIAALHLQVRKEQVASGENTFTDILDSQLDLRNIGQFYVQPGGNFFIAQEISTGAIAGFVGIQNNGEGEGTLKRLAVLSNYRGHRLGSNLVSSVVDWALVSDLRHIVLSTGQREKARPVYLAAGFEDYGFNGKNHLMKLVLAQPSK
ncbi:MAG: hypothetical protein JWO47_929 [Candidatus Saccharibacteria bacterium]|nr:hypothetical protein [Candidatus Saccharibacteria bacterium]